MNIYIPEESASHSEAAGALLDAFSSAAVEVRLRLRRSTEWLDGQWTVDWFDQGSVQLRSPARIIVVWASELAEMEVL